MDVAQAVELSIVIPVYNEQDSLVELHAQLTAALQPLSVSYEILFANDGSTDDSGTTIDQLMASDPHVGAIHFRRNFGKAAALDAAFRRVSGRYVITLDADLQDDPSEIPRFLTKLEEGFDVVSGWKHERRDPWDKTVPSKVFNWAVARVSSVALRDFNCGYKAYRAEALQSLQLYGELHRYIPVLLHWEGFRIAELPVKHHPRRFGYSKYGVERLLKGFFDLLTVLLNTRYRTRPLHMFGFVGALLGTSGMLILGYLSALWFLRLSWLGQRPLLLLGMLLVMVGVQLVSTGLLGELVNRGQRAERQDYTIRVYVPPRRALPQSAVTPLHLREDAPIVHKVTTS